MMTARLVTVCNQKGGCGKTHLAMTLGGALGARGLRVLVVDADPQGTATRWYAAAPEGRPFPATVVSLAETRGQIARALKAHLDHYDVIVVDCPPSLDTPVTLSTLVVADVALVPTIPAPGDLWATSRLVGLVEQARALNDALQVRVVPNMVQGTALAAAALQALDEIPLPLARSAFGLRTAYRQAQAEGTTALLLRDARAAAEIGTLVDEVADMLDLTVKTSSTPKTAPEKGSPKVVRKKTQKKTQERTQEKTQEKTQQGARPASTVRGKATMTKKTRAASTDHSKGPTATTTTTGPRRGRRTAA
jgi:chromosome partitioning protein